MLPGLIGVITMAGLQRAEMRTDFPARRQSFSVSPCVKELLASLHMDVTLKDFSAFFGSFIFFSKNCIYPTSKHLIAALHL